MPSTQSSATNLVWLVCGRSQVGIRPRRLSVRGYPREYRSQPDAILACKVYRSFGAFLGFEAQDKVLRLL